MRNLLFFCDIYDFATIALSLKLLKIFDSYSFEYLAKNKEMAITRLSDAIETLILYQLDGKMLAFMMQTTVSLIALEL